MTRDYLFEKTSIQDKLIKVRRRLKNGTIVGIFLENNIRFYYESIYEQTNNRILNRLFHMYSEDFEVKDNQINMDVSECYYIKQYNFEDEVYILYSKKYLDIIPKENLKGYLNDFDFVNIGESRIKNSKILLFKREIDRNKINFSFKGLD